MAAISSTDPRTGLVVEEVGPESTPADVDAAVHAALGAVDGLAALGIEGRARLLEAMADGLEAEREPLVALADRETALGEPRLGGELTRTTYQLRFLAGVVRDGACFEAVIDHAHDTPMGRLPDVRRLLVPVGPVAMFGASNFPFAFSVAGGDTAAALAAGCPVVAKAHSSHPALSRARGRGARPRGGRRRGAGGHRRHRLRPRRRQRARGAPRRSGPSPSPAPPPAAGRCFDLASGRPDPIPFYGELGSLNPLTVTPAAAAERGPEIAAGWVGSFTLGTGQFCTKPGLALVPAGPAGDGFRDAAVARLATVGVAWMLNGSMHAAFRAGVDRLGAVPGAVAHAAAVPAGAPGFAVAPVLVETTTAGLRTHPSPLLDECFGPVAVLARYADEADLLDVLAGVEGSLTASVHVAAGETDLPARVLAVVAGRAGRLIVDGYPTGVGVTWAMQHGGPWPAATNAGHTSVGGTSIRRFLRPLSYQAVPEALLPPELRDANPLGPAAPRRRAPRTRVGPGARAPRRP